MRLPVILTFLQKNYSKNLSSQEIGKELGIYPGTINRLLRSATGHNISSLICNLRIRQATVLLQSSTKNITEICDIIGFSAPNHFTVAFKKQMGMTPIAYRKAWLEGNENP